MADKPPANGTPRFNQDFRDQLRQLFLWRRDVRRFRTEPVDDALFDELLSLAALAPSVGNSQPWRFVKVDDDGRRDAIRGDFETCNREALNDYDGEKAGLYARLKLSGLERAPVHLAVFVDRQTLLGHGLGQRTMPETLDYSAVAAINILWLAARAHGIGVGWVSILNPENVSAILDTPESWSLVAYLCIGYPQEEHLDPELERQGWQERMAAETFITQR